ncbi:MAG: hypothetical protein JW704_10860 [Anaerolineaceae bacterium]|nr:hypothetical protein [Anaerolineaceae bacterium]MBN2677548.1 hypothetical protein [Anaerolineaceae bacterium]
MSTKKSFLTQKHVLVILLVLLGAGLLAASPTLLGINRSEESPISNEVFDKYELIETPAEQIYFPADDEEKPYTYFLLIVARAYEYELQAGVPVYLPNYVHTDAGCNWMGIAGQVFGRDGNPVEGLSLLVSGVVNGQTISQSGITGNAQDYGPGGYEVQIASKPFASSGSLQIVVRDKLLTQITVPVSFSTYADCSRNLILINFTPR